MTDRWRTGSSPHPRPPSTGEEHALAPDQSRARAASTTGVQRRPLVGFAVAVAYTALIAAVGSPGRAAPTSDLPIPSDRLVVVTDAEAAPLVAGCCDVTLADAATGRVLPRRRTLYADSPSVGQVDVTSDGSLVAWGATYNHWFLRVVMWSPEGNTWTTGVFYEGTHRAALGGAVAFSPDDQTLLVTDANSVWKYQVRNITTRRLGPVEKLVIDPSFGKPGDYRNELVAAAIESTADSKTAYVVANDGYVYTLDVEAMAWQGERIAYEVVAEPLSRRARRTFAALSPDERYLIVNRGESRTGENDLTGELNLVDLAAGRSSLILAPGTKETWGVDFNYSGANRGLLAVHGRESVGVYDLRDGELSQVASQPVPRHKGERAWPWNSRDRWYAARFSSLAWSGSTRLVAHQNGFKQWGIWELTSDSPRTLDAVASFPSCILKERPGSTEHDYVMGFDVAAIQARPTLTATPLPSNTPTTTLTPSVTPTPTATSTTPSPSVTPSVTVTASATPTNTAVPEPLLVPLALREHCDPVHERADIALVLDTSSSMQGAKIEDAKAAALAFVGLIDLAPGRSQVAVVRFDREAEVVRQLTNGRALIEAATRNLQVRSGTHIDKGLRAALTELQSPRHLERNMQVLILLTDGVQTGTPGEELRAAAEVHAADVLVYTIGLGTDVDETTLRAIAGADEHCFFAPDSGDLARIYGEIARDLMCPGVELWGGR